MCTAVHQRGKRGEPPRFCCPPAPSLLVVRGPPPWAKICGALRGFPIGLGPLGGQPRSHLGRRVWRQRRAPPRRSPALTTATIGASRRCDPWGRVPTGLGF
eukprot:3193928-Pyramimonas_sp.AAC.1